MKKYFLESIVKVNGLLVWEKILYIILIHYEDILRNIHSYSFFSSFIEMKINVVKLNHMIYIENSWTITIYIKDLRKVQSPSNFIHYIHIRFFCSLHRDENKRCQATKKHIHSSLVLFLRNHFTSTIWFILRIFEH